MGALDRFAESWDEKISADQPLLAGELVNALFNYPEDIRKAIYTIHAIESLNSLIRKATKKRKVFPIDGSATKVIYLAIQEVSKKMDHARQKLESGPQSFFDSF